MQFDNFYIFLCLVTFNCKETAQTKIVWGNSEIDYKVESLRKTTAVSMQLH